MSQTEIPSRFQHAIDLGQYIRQVGKMVNTSIQRNPIGTTVFQGDMGRIAYYADKPTLVNG